MIDDKDAEILTIVQSNARTSAAEIARQVGMAPSAVFERLKKLEERGVLRGYAALVDPRAVGAGLLAFVQVTAQEGGDCASVGRALAALPEVQEVHHVAGGDDYLVKIRAADPESLGRILRETFRSIPGLRSTRTTVVLETIKESVALPIPATPPPRPPAAKEPRASTARGQQG